MQNNIPRSSIHVGANKKTFTSQMGNEAERRGWDEKRYQSKNAEDDKNNHYNFSRKNLNFEITKGGKVVPLGSNPVPVHLRLQKRHDELGFKPYMDAKHPDQIARNSPNSLVNMIFGGDHKVMKRLAYGDQEIDTSDPYADYSHIKLMPEIIQWAKDTYAFVARLVGEENIIAFDVHCDETGIHAHVLTVPVEKVKKRGRIGSQYAHKDNPNKVLTTKEWKALPKEERADYIKSEAVKDVVERVSYAKVWGETAKEKSQFLSDLHTRYYNEVGKKYGLQRGVPYNELSDEEKRERRHKSKVVLEAERQARLAVAEAEREKAEIEAETADIKEQRDKAEKDLKAVQSGVLAKIFQPGKYKKGMEDKLNAAFKAGIDKATDTILEVSKLKWEKNPSPEQLGQHYRSLWDSSKHLAEEAKDKEKTISEMNAEIDGLKLKVMQLTEEMDGLKFRLTLVDEDAVSRLRTSLKEAKTNEENAKGKLRLLHSAYSELVAKWDSIWKEPEMNNAWDNVKKRKTREERAAAEAKRMEEARQERRNGLIDRFIREGRSTLLSFARTGRSYFNEDETPAIYYGIIASAVKFGFNLCSEKGVKSATGLFLSDISWNGFTYYKEDLIKNWTKIFATSEVTFPEDAVKGFIKFIDYMSASADTYQTSMGGSNGCANQLTNWDGTKNHGWGTPEKKKKGQSL